MIRFSLASEVISNENLRSYAELSININNNFKDAEKEYYLARISQIFFHFSSAEQKYSKIIDSYQGTHWAMLSKYWKEQLPIIEDRFSNY